MNKVICAIVLLNIFWNFPPGLAYRCYECQEEKGKGLDCETNVKNVLQPNCTESFQCIKYIWTTGNSTMIYRGCAPQSKCIELKATVSENHTLDVCSLCDSPLCNYAPISNSTARLWSFLILLVFLCTKI